MPSPSKNRLAAGALLLACAARLVAGEADERAVARLWTQHLAASNRHAEAAAACRAAEPALAASPLLPVCRGIQAWHLLKAGATQDAVAVLGRLTEGASPSVAPAAELMANRWLTRLDRERVRVALRGAYRKDVQYPVTLERLRKLPGGEALPLADRWGQPWKYAPVAFAGLAAQRFALESVRMGGASDLDGALAQPHAVPADIAPVRLMGDSGARLVEFTTGDAAAPRKAVVGEGGDVGRYTLAYVGDRILVLSDSDRWTVLAMPP
jgi:hypothetical protein